MLVVTLKTNYWIGEFDQIDRNLTWCWSSEIEGRDCLNYWEHQS